MNLTEQKRELMAIDVLLSKPPKGYKKQVVVNDFEAENPHVYLEPLDGGIEILLPMPTSISSNDVPIWEMQEFGNNALARGVDFAKDASMRDAALGLLKDAGGATLENVGMAGDSFDLAMSKAGIMHHPLKEIMFKGANFRTFSFEWELIPLNKKDADNINAFIETLQKYSLPKHKAGYQGYPSLWWIEFEPSIDYLPVIMDSAITNLQINYSGVGKPVFHDEVVPVQTNISVEFTETEIHTRDHVEAGIWG